MLVFMHHRSRPYLPLVPPPLSCPKRIRGPAAASKGCETTQVPPGAQKMSRQALPVAGASSPAVVNVSCDHMIAFRKGQKSDFSFENICVFKEQNFLMCRNRGVSSAFISRVKVMLFGFV